MSNFDHHVSNIVVIIEVFSEVQSFSNESLLLQLSKHYMSRKQTTYKDWVSDEEDWGVITDEIPVSLICVKLDGKSTRISSCIC